MILELKRAECEQRGLAFDGRRHSFPHICVNIMVKEGGNAGKYNNLEDRAPVSYKKS